MRRERTSTRDAWDGGTRCAISGGSWFDNPGRTSALQGTGEALGMFGSMFGIHNEMAKGDEMNPFSVAGDVFGTVDSAVKMADRFTDYAPSSGFSDFLGMGGNLFGAVTGYQDMADSNNDTEKRALGGVSGTASALSLAGDAALLAGGQGTFSLATMGSMSAGTALTGGAAGTTGLAAAGTALASVGAVAGAGVAGYKVGQTINDINNSDYARSSLYGQDQYTGQDRTLNDAVIDSAVGIDQWIDEATGTDIIGDVVGGTTAAVGSILAAPAGLATAAGSWIASGVGSLVSGW